VPEQCIRIDEETVNKEINKLDETKRKEEEEMQKYRFM
jgi:histone acetyltransferase MYST1